jgi:prephenate dehydrogenase
MKRWNTVAIVGVGLIGGSIGLALRKRKLAKEVVGIGRRRSSLAKALARGCVTKTSTSISRGVAGAEIVVICTPVELVAQQAAEAAACGGENMVITDAGSTKAAIVSAAESALLALENSASGGPAFVGSHPLAGSEKTGCEAARADLLENRLVIVTPTAQTSRAATATVSEFWKSLGARVVAMSPEQHDATLARTSHLPHFIASALAAATPEDVLPLTATGWGDTTRIAAGDVELWRQILLANAAHTLSALDDFERVLARLRSALKSGDGLQLAELLAEGKRRRDAVGS